ncbi:hypothetical protein BDR22DRAFT_961781 [Usnea florida]
MCLFQYYEFECGCQIYHDGEAVYCDAERNSDRSLNDPTTVLIPHTDEHDDIDRWYPELRYLTMPQDRNLAFRWHPCKELTYAPVTPKRGWFCYWHGDGVKNRGEKKTYLEDMRKESRMERERLEKGHRKKSKEKSQQLEKRTGKMGKGRFFGLVRHGGVSNK